MRARPHPTKFLDIPCAVRATPSAALAVPALVLAAGLVLGWIPGAQAEFAARRTPPQVPQDDDSPVPVEPDATLALYLSDRLQAFSPGACRSISRIERASDGIFIVYCRGQGPYRVPPPGSPLPTVNCAGTRPWSIGGC